MENVNTHPEMEEKIADGGRVTEIISDIEKVTETGRGGFDFASKYKTFLKTLNDFSESEKAQTEDLLMAAIRCGDSSVLETITFPIFDKRKFVDWKNRSDLIDRMIDVMIETACLEANRRHYTRFMEKLMTVIKSFQLIDKHCDKIYDVIRKSLSFGKDPDRPIHNAALCCITQFPWSDHPDLIIESVKLMRIVVKENPDLRDGAWLHTDLGILLTMMMRANTGGAVIKINGMKVGTDKDPVKTTLHMSVLDDISDLFNFCANQDWQYSEDPIKHNICYTMLKCILEDFLNSGQTKPEIVKPMYSSILELRQCGDATLERDANYIMTAMAGHTELTGGQTGELLQQFIDGKLPQIAFKMVDMYKQQPDLFFPLLPSFVSLLSDTDQTYKAAIIQLLTEVAKTAPDKLPSNSSEVISKYFQDKATIYLALMFFDALAVGRPSDVIGLDDDIIKTMADATASTMAAGILSKLATDKDHQRKYLDSMAKAVTSMPPGPFQIGIIMNMRLIGVNSPQMLAEYRSLFEKLRETPVLKDMCQSALDVIEGRSLEKVSKDVSEQGKEIADIDTRLTETEESVVTVVKVVDGTKMEVERIQTDVRQHEVKLENLTEVVEETVEKVEGIDHKTLSHAPSWSRDVSKLLNPEADHDWRLLASRLGYSHDDIRNWATQPDPCLSMLDEWFATHKTREATYGVLKTLVEMDRTDASVIVDLALSAVECVVDDDDDEPSAPPPIFLSYQWAHQPEVKLLKRHLGMAGYSSWMDIGQMGGGDKLFAKIDAGIRAAKVIVCCVTQRYSESPNCNREVNLSVTLGKPIIPLLMENMPWPPSGAMGPIFGEYIFVRFFQRDGETTDDDRYWSSDKFNELLMQIRYNIAPDVALITKDSPYQNWWTPPKEIVIIKKKIQPVKSLPPVETVERTGNKTEFQSPEIFISYQWDKQPQIKALYRRLTELGYTCWLDIMQMGGGDSLYDKIDRGVRGCKLVLSCVTSKYAMSANCRREVSLADAIKKPIIPLLLEKITWPPEGPMAMVLTQLLYIDFCHPNEDSQNRWNGSRFDELLKKIDEYLKTDIMANRQPEQRTKSVGLWDVKNTNTDPVVIAGQTVETAKRAAGASSQTRPNRPGNPRISAKLNSGSKMTYPPTKTTNTPIKQGSKMASSRGVKSNNPSVVSPASSNRSFIAVNSSPKTVNNSTKTTPASLKSNNASVKTTNISNVTANWAAETTHPTPAKMKSSSVTSNPMSLRLIQSTVTAKQSTVTAKSSADPKKLSNSTKSATPPIKPPDHSTNNAQSSDCPGVSPYPSSGSSNHSVETAKITESN